MVQAQVVSVSRYAPRVFLVRKKHFPPKAKSLVANKGECPVVAAQPEEGVNME